MKNYVLLPAFILFPILLYAQDYQLTDSLKRNLEQAKTNAEKIKWLGELSTFYTTLNRELADDYGNQQLEIAELSRDRELMLKALLSNAGRYFNLGGLQENVNKAKEYSQKAFDLASSNHLDNYTAWAYMYLARAARINGEMDKALNFNNLAVSLALASQDDSLKVFSLISLGNTYINKSEKLLAFRHYLQALNLAEKVRTYTLMKNSYYAMSSFYSGLEEYEKAKDYLFKMQKLTYAFKEPYDRLDVYNSLGKIYTSNKQYDLATGFYEKAMALSDTLKLEVYKLNSYGNIIEQYFASNQAEKGLKYFNSKPELKAFMLNAGYDYFINQAYGIAYMEIGKLDSAGYYLAKAEPGFEKTNKANRYWFYNNYSRLYKMKGDYKKSLAYALKSKKIGDEIGNLNLLQNTSSTLDSIYQKLGDFRNAYFYNSKYHLYKDSLEKISTEKDLLLLEVDNENKRKVQEAETAENAKRTRHNIQYLGITAAIAGVFIVLAMLGTFSVSKTTIRILGFFAFIFLFEFIILLADNRIHHWTHGEPWKILAIKIGLVSILLPLHHFIERRVIHYLTSHKMLDVNPKDLFNKFAGKEEIDSALNPKNLVD